MNQEGMTGRHRKQGQDNNSTVVIAVWLHKLLCGTFPRLFEMSLNLATTNQHPHGTNTKNRCHALPQKQAQENHSRYSPIGAVKSAKLTTSSKTFCRLNSRPLKSTTRQPHSHACTIQNNLQPVSWIRLWGMRRLFGIAAPHSYQRKGVLCTENNPGVWAPLTLPWPQHR